MATASSAAPAPCARTIIGVLIVGVLNNLMVLLGIPAESQNIVKGALIVGAVFLDLRLRK